MRYTWANIIIGHDVYERLYTQLSWEAVAMYYIVYSIPASSPTLITANYSLYTRGCVTVLYLKRTALQVYLQLVHSVYIYMYIVYMFLR